MQIDIQGISKEYVSGEDVVRALQNIDISITSQTFCSIVGTSGSGKSTLLYMIAGLEHPTSGSISIDNQPIIQLTHSQMDTFRNQHIGFIFQQFMLLKDFTVEENVMLPYFIASNNKKESIERAHILLEKLGLIDKYKRYPDELSGGQAQRVAIARALINHPSILLADEPTGNLDHKNQDIVMALLLELKQQFHFTLVLVTHNIQIAKSADQVISLEFGQIK